MTKKLFSVTLSAAIAAGCITPIMAQDVVTLSGGSVYVKAGEEFTMPFSAEHAENIKNCTIELSFDSKYITPITGSVENSGENTYIQDVAASGNKIIIVASGLNTKDYGDKIFSYKFKASPELTDEITAGISINVTNLGGEDISKLQTINGTVNINKTAPAEPTTEPTQTPAPSTEPSQTPIPSIAPSIEPSQTPIPSIAPSIEPSQTPSPSIAPSIEPSQTPVQQKEQVISIAAIADKQYGDAPFALSVTPDANSGLTDMTYSSSNENIAVVDASGTVTITGAGICEITAAQAGNENYKPASAKVSMTVNKKLLKVYPNDLTITYGDALPQNLIAFDGFVNAQDEDELSKQVVISGLPETIVPNTYKLTLSGINSDKYKVSYSEGTLTIKQKPLTISALKVYDKLADGNNSAIINASSAVLDGINVGDDVKLNIGAAKAEFAQAEAGDNIAVKITGLSLTGKDAAKYTLSTSEFDTTANIKSTMTAAEAAASINSVPTIEKDVHDMVLPYIGSGFTVKIATTSNSAVISTDGKIGYLDNDTEVELTFSVTKGDDSAVSSPIKVTVPASTKVTLSQAPLSGEIYGLGTFYKGQEVSLKVGNGIKVRAWYVNGSKYDTNSTTLNLTANADMEIKVETYKHNGGSLQGNAVSRVTTSVSASNKVIAGTTIELSTNTTGATIYYTTDGSTPTKLSKKYTGGIDIDESMVIKAIAVKNGMNSSSVSTFDYTVRYANTELKNNANTIKYMAAYADNTFRPDQAATRYEVIDALNNLLDIEEIGNKKTFSDVDSEHADVVAKFADVGIISGYGNGTFGGNRSITRAEFVTLLTKAWNIGKTSGYSTFFNDVSGHWAADMIDAFATKGYVSGYPDGGFHPDDKVTRAEVVSVINRMVGTKAISLSQKYVDLAPTHWAYSQIMAVVS